MIFEPLRFVGPLDALLLLFSVFVTIFLFVSRVRRSRSDSSIYDLRDVVMLFCGPVISVLLLLAYASLGVSYYATVDLDSDQPLRIGMQSASACISVGICCFVLGVVGILWPVARSKSQ